MFFGVRKNCLFNKTNSHDIIILDYKNMSIMNPLLIRCKKKPSRHYVTKPIVLFNNRFIFSDLFCTELYYIFEN